MEKMTQAQLDAMIKARRGEGSLIGAMEIEEKKKRAEKEVVLLQWKDDLKKYPYLYIVLCVSALFTLTLGMFMGIAPKVDLMKGQIIYQTDALHLFLALVYMIAFVTVTEGAFGIAKWLYHTRENNNNTQEWTMLVMMMIAGFSIVGTGIAGGMVIASNIAFLSAFIEIPEAAQKWVIVIIPILLAVYTSLLSAYALSSNQARSERMLGQDKRKSELDNIIRQQSIMQIGAEKMQLAELNRYMELIEKGVISAADATAAMLAGRTLKQEEKRTKRDLDGDGRIADQPVRIAFAAETKAEEIPNADRGNKPR
jgi:hypothetical protein